MDMTRWFADNASAAGAACGVTLSPGEDAEVEATGETVGWFDYTLEVPEGEDRICFDLDVVQYASDGTSAGHIGGVNGGVYRNDLLLYDCQNAAPLAEGSPEDAPGGHVCVGGGRRKMAFYPHSIYYKDWSLWAPASHADKFTLHDSETGGSQKGTLSAPVSYLGGSWVRLWTATYVGHLQPEVFWIEGLQPQAGIVIRLTECRTEPRAPGRYEHIDQVTVNVVKMELETPEQDQEFHMNMGTATEGPTMPEIELRALVEPALEGIQYRFQVGNPETGQALVYEDAPAGYEHPTTIDSEWIAESRWAIDFGEDIYGGHVTHVTVSVRIEGQDVCCKTFERDFWILGDALTTAVRNAYIDTLNNYAANIRTMAKAIAVQETAGTHFWPTGYHIGGARHNRYPIVSQRQGDEGYGVMQLTAANLLTRDTIWNWKSNIDKAMVFLQTCYNNGVTHLNAHPANVTDVMRRLEGYDRYNAGEDDRYHWWNDTPRPADNLPNVGWIKFGYTGVQPDGRAYRDYNNDGVADAAGNPFSIPGGPVGPNVPQYRGARYADQTIQLEP